MSEPKFERQQTRRSFVSGLAAAGAAAMTLSPAVANAQCAGSAEVFAEGGYLYVTIWLTTEQKEAIATQTPNGVIVDALRLRLVDDGFLEKPLEGNPLGEKDPWPI